MQLAFLKSAAAHIIIYHISKFEHFYLTHLIHMDISGKDSIYCPLKNVLEKGHCLKLIHSR